MKFITLSVVLMTFLTGCGVDWFPSDSTTSASSVSITSTTLPDAPTGLSYGQTLTATGGTAPYKWSIASGTLPNVVSLSDGGIISGIPTTPTTFPATTPVYTFTVKVADSAASPATTTKSFTISTPITNKDSTSKVFAYVLRFDVTLGVVANVMNNDVVTRAVQLVVTNTDATTGADVGTDFTMPTVTVLSGSSNLVTSPPFPLATVNNWRIKTVTIIP